MGCNKTVKLLSFVFKHKVLKVHLPGFVESRYLHVMRYLCYIILVAEF